MSVRKRLGETNERSRSSSPGSNPEDDVSFNTYEDSSPTNNSNETTTTIKTDGDKPPPAATNSTAPRFLRSITQHLSPRWVNWVVRLFTAIMLVSGFCFLIYLGPLALVLLVLVLQMCCFREIINIGLIVYRIHDLPWFRILSWQFLVTSNYFLFGESIISHFRLLLARENFLQPLITYHRLISYTLYCVGFMVFVLTLVKKRYLQQFLLFGWTHVSLLIIVFSSHSIISNIFHGFAWFILPVAMVICNDIMAYVFGFFFGKTPLIQLSPKKTWEGFIGGGLSTVLFGFLFAVYLVRHDSYVCPLEWDEAAEQLTSSCIRNPVFLPTMYNSSVFLPKFLPTFNITWYPFWTHAFIVGLYVSIIGPFGGFFASGFKRAFRLKDFGDVFPGHGGVMDRFDCQLIVGVFVNIYYYSLVQIHSSSNILAQVYRLLPEDQLDLYRQLTDGLQQRGLLPSEVASFVGQAVESLTTGS